MKNEKQKTKTKTNEKKNNSQEDKHAIFRS